MRSERTRLLSLFWWCLAVLPALAQAPASELPATAAAQLAESLAASKSHARHIWRDTPPLNDDGTVNGYVEIARGDRRKWEFDMAANERAIDRMIPEQVGGYPVNYGFVPQTVSYDGDPFDILVLGPPIEGGRLVRGAIVGLMLMEDEKGPGRQGRRVDARRRGPAAASADRQRSPRDDRLLPALQAARARQVLEGARVGIDRRRSGVGQDHAPLFQRMPRRVGRAVPAVITLILKPSSANYVEP